MRVLLVDDDPELLELLERALRRDGHVARVASGVETARDALEEGVYDVVVLDIGLPDGSGVELCRDMRAGGRVEPVLLLTAQSAVSQRVAGLDAGADDYLVKPFAVAELRARVRALGRRRPAEPTLQHRSGEVELDLGRRRARRAGLDVELTPREWAILEVLSAAKGRVVAKDRLIQEVWGEASETSAASLEVLLSRIRRKLGHALIRTHRGLGYAIQ